MNVRKTTAKLAERAALGGMKAGFRLGERLVPRLTARAASALWFRVPPAPPPTKRDRGVRPGERLDIAVNGRPIAAYSWGEGPTVLLVHGWSGWWQQLGVYVEPLVAAGHRVVAWDAPAHGDSPEGIFGRRRSGMPELKDAIDAVAQSVGEVHGLVAHSGGAMAASLAVAEGLDVARVAFIAPSVLLDDILELLGGRLDWGPRTVREMLAALERDYGLHAADFDVPAVLGRRDLPFPRALFVHDEDDTETPVAGSDVLAGSWPGARVHRTSGLGHYKVLWAEPVVREVTEFLTE
jgi:pimeloyl-ACP methyl ester carboxylesterase